MDDKSPLKGVSVAFLAIFYSLQVHNLRPRRHGRTLPDVI